MAENTSQRPLLYVEQKEDSAEKLAQVTGKPHENFLFAGEFNATVAAINLLHTFMAMTASTVLAVIGNDKLELGELGELEDMDFIDVINFSDPAVELGVTGAKYITFTENGLLRVYAYVGDPGLFGDGHDPLTPVQLLQLYIQPDSEENGKRYFYATIDSIDTDNFTGFFCHDDQIGDITWSFPEPGRLRATSPSFADRRKVLPDFKAAKGPREVNAIAHDGYVDFVGVQVGGGGTSGTWSSFQQGKIEIILFNNAATLVQNPE